MIKSIRFYFHKGRQKQRRYFKRNFLGLYFYAFYALASLIGSFSCFAFPLFSSSGYNIFKMLDETDDAYITKSFDGGDDGKNYLSRFLFAFFVVILMAIDATLTYFITLFLDNFLISFLGEGTMNQLIFSWLFKGIAIALCAFLGILLLLFLQVGSYVGAKNHALGVGDIAFNAGNFILKHGVRLFFLDFVATLYYAIVPFLFTALWWVLETLHLSGGGDYFGPLALGVLLLLILVSPMIFGRYFLSLKMASYYLFEDGADTSAYKVVYPEKPDKKPSEEGIRGHYIEAIPLDDSEEEEPTPIEVDTKEEDK